MNEIIEGWLGKIGIRHDYTGIAVQGIFALGLIVLAYLSDKIAKMFFLKGVTFLITRSDNKWDDILLKKKVFNRLAHLVPALVVHALATLTFSELPYLAIIIKSAAKIYMIIIGLLVVDSLLSAVLEIYSGHPISRHKPINGYIQVTKIIINLIGVILIISIMMNKSPVYLLGGLGALTAVLMLVFKDTILGFVASIQLAANNMVRPGDWIEMSNYGADGDVIDVSLTTVKVQNWDKTITTIPTYALIAESFKNWRGMSDAGGRRIKRAIHINISSIKFCSQEMLTRFKKIQLIADYIKKKETDVVEFNKTLQVDETELINGRRLTNIGTLRAYIEAYLRQHPKIHNEMTFMVRQLSPTAHGLPLEIYVFSNDQRWVNYEGIQADIFDHFLAIVPFFDLSVFQNPSGIDFKRLGA